MTTVLIDLEIWRRFPKFLDFPAPARLLQPKPEVLDAIAALIPPTLLRSFAHFSASRNRPHLPLGPPPIEHQPTAAVTASIFGLFPAGPKRMAHLIATILDRQDFFEALESTAFDAHMCDRRAARERANTIALSSPES
jgi:hypothetical protein